MEMEGLKVWPISYFNFERFGGRLHIDSTKDSVASRSFAMVAHGENIRPERCKRPWLGATDIEEEGVWRDSETNEILDLSEYWSPGQPNGVRIQNCAGIWELVRQIVVKLHSNLQAKLNFSWLE